MISQLHSKLINIREQNANVDVADGAADDAATAAVAEAATALSIGIGRTRIHYMHECGVCVCVCVRCVSGRLMLPSVRQMTVRTVRRDQHT